jgi:predicted nucleic acid-binding protein
MIPFTFSPFGRAWSLRRKSLILHAWDADLRWEFFAELVAASRRSLRNAIDDAYLAALAISRGAALVSFDQDFELFVRHGLRWEKPAR